MMRSNQIRRRSACIIELAQTIIPEMRSRLPLKLRLCVRSNMMPKKCAREKSRFKISSQLIPSLYVTIVMAIIPALIVFDLDLTLWNFTFDADMLAPFSKDADGTVFDSAGRKVKYFPEVPDILALMYKHDIKLAVISRSFKFPAVHQLLETLDWKKYLSYDVIHSGGVKALLKELQHITKIRYPDMLFFDDSFYNIRQARSCDIVGVQVPNGMTPDDLKRGFDQFIRHKGGLSLSVEADRYSKATQSRKQAPTQTAMSPVVEAGVKAAV